MENEWLPMVPKFTCFILNTQDNYNFVFYLNSKFPEEAVYLAQLGQDSELPCRKKAFNLKTSLIEF